MSDPERRVTLPLPLFPLRTVLFPGARLSLRVFEARYTDLVADCLRSGQPFGVVLLTSGAEAGPGGDVQLEAVGTLAHIRDCDAQQPGLLRLVCSGGQRFRIEAAARRSDNGLWLADAVQMLADDPARAPGPAMLKTVEALAQAIRTLSAQGRSPFDPPYRLDHAGWVANRWCELLPVPMAARQKLMELQDPVLRLSLVDGFLRDRKVVLG